MSISTNGGTNPSTVLYNGLNCTEVLYNGVHVWPDDEIAASFYWGFLPGDATTVYLSSKKAAADWIPYYSGSWHLMQPLCGPITLAEAGNADATGKPWNLVVNNIMNKVTKIVVMDKIKFPQHCGHMFCQFYNLVEIEGWDKIDTSEVLTMTDMFLDCQSLKTIDLRYWDMSKVQSMFYFARGCKSLTTIYTSKKSTSFVEELPSLTGTKSTMTVPRYLNGKKFEEYTAYAGGRDGIADGTKTGFNGLSLTGYRYWYAGKGGYLTYKEK